MGRSRRSHYFLGLLIIVAGIGILFDNLGLMHFNFGHLIPFFMMFFSLKLLERGRKIVGSIILIWSILLFFGIWFRIWIGDFFGLIFSFAIIYAGYRLIRSKKKEIHVPPPTNHPPKEESSSWQEEQQHDKTGPSSTYYSVDSPDIKQSLIGNLFLTGSRWELKDMNIWHGIGEVKVDLSRASVREGETVLVISGWIGDIDIYVPYDLEISVIANINVGDIDVFGHKQGGLNRSLTITTANYRESTRKVRIIVSLLVGDIDIRYV